MTPRIDEAGKQECYARVLAEGLEPTFRIFPRLRRPDLSVRRVLHEPVAQGRDGAMLQSHEEQERRNDRSGGQYQAEGEYPLMTEIGDGQLQHNA